MTPFVLVHGAWHGSWCWKRVRTSLQAKGHDVFTPTLTGVAERSRIIRPRYFSTTSMIRYATNSKFGTQVVCEDLKIPGRFPERQPTAAMG